MKAPNYISRRGLYCLERLLWQNVAIIFLGMNTLWALLFWLRNDPKILSIGYNGMPLNCSDDDFTWERDTADDNKYFYTVHSELNAILNYRGGSLEGSKIYVTLFPCNECAKAIIQSGIKAVIYRDDLYKDTKEVKASKRMLKTAGVDIIEYQSTGRVLEITL